MRESGAVSLSIITPCINCIKHIEGCLENIIGQWEPGIEHLVIDGGSQDGTEKIIRAYAKQHAHIRWISEPDSGQSDAMNKGIAIAKGEIIGFLNVDDFYERGVLRRVMQIAPGLTEPTLMVGNCFVWSDDGDLLLINKPRKMSYKRLLYGPVVQPYPLNPSAYFYHASLHRQVGGYDVKEHYALDAEFIFRAARVAHIQYYDEHWGNFNLRKGTKTYEDISVGISSQRGTEIISKHQEKLPPFARLFTKVVYRFSTIKFVIPIFYFSRQPEEILPRLKKRLSAILKKVFG